MSNQKELWSYVTSSSGRCVLLRVNDQLVGNLSFAEEAPINKDMTKAAAEKICTLMNGTQAKSEKNNNEPTLDRSLYFDRPVTHDGFNQGKPFVISRFKNGDDGIYRIYNVPDMTYLATVVFMNKIGLLYVHANCKEVFCLIYADLRFA